jgi:hypothetical protein
MKVATFRELMREQANAALHVSGAHHSSWNGRFGAPLDRQSDLGGTANWDNSISYNPRHVDERLQEMFRNARVHLQDKADLRGYRDALRVVLHENVHLLSSEGREFSQSYSAMANGSGVRPFEEGVTELYSHQKLDEYIDELGIDQIAPGIKDVKSPKVYKQFTPAVEGFAEAIERRSGVPLDELIGRLAVVPADQKFRAAAEAMYDNSKLPGLVPQEQREQAIGQIANAMAPQFGQISKLPDDAAATARRAIGAQAAGEGYKVVSQLTKQWQMPAPGQQVQRGVGAEQERSGQAERGGGPQAPASPAAQGPAAPAAASAVPALPPDIAAAARAGLSGPPLGSASRLSADRQGVRGAGVSAPAAQRQGPETQR